MTNISMTDIVIAGSHTEGSCEGKTSRPSVTKTSICISQENPSKKRTSETL